MRRALLCPVLLVSLVFATVTAAQSPITGTWITTEFDDIPNLIDLEVNGSTVIGAISRLQQVYPIYDGRVDGNTVAFKVFSAWGGHRTISFTGRLNDGVISFTRSVQVMPGTTVTGGGQGMFRADGKMEFEAKRETATATGIPRGMLGNWKHKPELSTYDPGPRPQPMMIPEMSTIVALPGGWISYVGVGVNPNGAPFLGSNVSKPDGRDYLRYSAADLNEFLMSGTPTPLTFSVRTIDARTAEFTYRNNGSVGAISRVVVSPDASTLQWTTRNMNAEGAVTATNTHVWERQPPETASLGESR